jgi:hypothetical protein
MPAIAAVTPQIPDFVTPLPDDPFGMGMGVHGPTVARYRPWGIADGGGWPHHPGLHGRYLVIDLDVNNRYQREQFEKRTGQAPRSFGFGVCRQGFGLENFPTLTQAEAERVAIELNARHLDERDGR